MRTMRTRKKKKKKDKKIYYVLETEKSSFFQLQISCKAVPSNRVSELREVPPA